MHNDDRTRPLREWSDLARENTENAIVSSMFEATEKASEPIENFSTWLLVAAGAVASFLISNADKVIPFISKTGFIICGAFLCLSCTFGLLSKVFSVRVRIGIETKAAIQETFSQHLVKYQKEESEIQDGAKFLGITLQTEIRLDRVLREFMAPYPGWVRWLASRHFIKHAKNPQIAHILQAKGLYAQGMSTFFQAICFIGFLGAGFVFAASI
jgi:hypothetical protein